jgi:hypothetical protein
MADAVSRLPYIEEARFRSYASLLEVCGGQSGAETGFFSKMLVSSINIIPPMRHNHLQLHVALTKRPMFEPWEPPENNAFSEIGEHWIEKYFQSSESFALASCYR